MKISLKRKAYEEAGIPADKAPHFAAQTVKANPAEQLSPLRHEDAEELKTEPKLTETLAGESSETLSLNSSPPSSAMSKRRKNEEMTLNALNAGSDVEDALEDGELPEDGSTD